MQVLEPQAGLLSNREVLELIQSDMEEAKVASEEYRKKRQNQKNDLRAMGKFPVGYKDADLAKLITPPNVTAAQRSVYAHLMEDQLPTHQQTLDSVINLTKALGKYQGGLTRGEKLQMVNSCPQSMPELYVIIDKLEERIPEEEPREELLNIIQSHLLGEQVHVSTAALDTQSRAEHGLRKEEHFQMGVAEELQEEQDELEAVEEEEDDDIEEEDMLITGGGGGGGAGQQEDLELDEQPEGEL